MVLGANNTKSIKDTMKPLTPHERAERLLDEATRQGLINPVTGEGAPTLKMIADAINDAEGDTEHFRGGDDGDHLCWASRDFNGKCMRCGKSENK